MGACEDFEVEKVNKDNDKVDDRVDDDHEGNNDVDDDHETDDAVLIFDLLTSAARRCSVSAILPYALSSLGNHLEGGKWCKVCQVWKTCSLLFSARKIAILRGKCNKTCSLSSSLLIMSHSLPSFTLQLFCFETKFCLFTRPPEGPRRKIAAHPMSRPTTDKILKRPF